MAEQHEKLHQMLDLWFELRAEGNTEDEIYEFMSGLKDLDFEKETEDLRRSGMPEEQIEAFWTWLSGWSDLPDDDDPDEGKYAWAP